jgi:hypothetical protein
VKQQRDHSKMLTIAPKMEINYDDKKNELTFKNLNFNIMGYIFAGINFLKLSQGVNGTKESRKQQ